MYKKSFPILLAAPRCDPLIVEFRKFSVVLTYNMNSFLKNEEESRKIYAKIFGSDIFSEVFL